MKIGLVLSQPPSYSETFFNSKVLGLQKAGHTVKLFVQTSTRDFKVNEVKTAPKVYKNPLIQIGSMIRHAIALIPHIRKVNHFLSLEKATVRSFKQRLKNVYTNAHLLKADVDWLHFGFATIALQSENVAQAIGAKMAVSCRGYDMDVYPLKHPKCYNLLWKRVDKVHVISNYMETKALSLGMQKETPVQCITPAIEGSKFQPDNNSKQKNKLQITTIARLHWIKGLTQTLEALARFKKSDIPFHYTIIGTGPQYEELAFAVHQLNLKNQVTLLGQAKQKEIIDILNQTDIYIQYSQSEGFCNAVLEAQAMDCTVVVSNGGALPENVIDGETGWVITKNKPELLAKTLKSCVEHWEDHEEIRRKAKERVKQHFNLQQQSKQFLEFYE
ncbi:glycosyltransferase family 4 protein [Winogradskyella maritima]|uniref:Glycosyltransferase family 4 protein n=1 Tax=Winogradskyella maritima TaxID=1517766 RepID=A0ABV8AK95_9FLAO|nr:glycosyltransferase family 4 protein [Winogradskyella maritima]